MSTREPKQYEEASLDVGTKVNNESNSELIERHHLEDTPFTVIKLEDGQVFGAMGQHRLTEVMEDVDECIELMKEFNWNRLIQVIMVMASQGLLDQRSEVEAVQDQKL